MKINPESFKEYFNDEHINWSSLYDEVINEKSFTLPLYLGVYSLITRRGFSTAEKEFQLRLDALISKLKKTENGISSRNNAIIQLEQFKERNKQAIDFKSTFFKEDCRSFLLKPFHKLIRSLESKNMDELITTKEIRSLKKSVYQLNPFNYSYAYLRHFCYVSEAGIKTLLKDDSKRKSIRNIDGIFELTTYISGLEIPRRKHKTALSYRYLIMEGDPCLDHTESVIFRGGSFDTSAGGGVKESWFLDNDDSWKHKKTANHWRR
jgi:hypothetical protein